MTSTEPLLGMWHNSTDPSPLKSAYSLVYNAARQLDLAKDVGRNNGTSGHLSWSPLMPKEQHFIDKNGLGVDRRGYLPYTGRGYFVSIAHTCVIQFVDCCC